MSTPVGGRKRKAWRLKKKHAKWFDRMLRELISDTLANMPPACFEGMWGNCNYPVPGIYK